MVNNEGINVISKIVEAEQKSQKLHDSILNQLPCYDKYITVSVLTQGDVEELKKFHELPKRQKLELVRANGEIVCILFKCLLPDLNLHLIQYVLTVLFETIRNDGSSYSHLLSVLKEQGKEGEVNETLTKLCEHQDSYIADKSCFLLSGLYCYNYQNIFKDAQIKEFIARMDGLNLTDEGRMDVYINILKMDRYRKDIYGKASFLSSVKKNLDLNNKSSNLQYKTVFCVWLLTFKEYFIKQLYKSGIVTLVIALFKKNRVEKIVRVCLNIIKNVYTLDDCFEIIVQNNIIQTLTVLEYDKWRDNDIYDSIPQLLHKLEQRVKNFSSFERYCLELSKGRLSWSVLHSEKFWVENVMYFEKDEFKVIQQLADIVKRYIHHSLLNAVNDSGKENGSTEMNTDSDRNERHDKHEEKNTKSGKSGKSLQSEKKEAPVDNVTVAVACFDLGEFARLYPNGKQICQNFKIKENIMMLITTKDREVAREALLCAQKIMLNNWQNVSGGK